MLIGNEDGVHFTVNVNQYKHPYLPADGIYPTLPVLVQTLNHPSDNAGRHFAKCQEAARKDIERAFGVFQARWEILKRPSSLWHLKDITSTMMCCIILDNMIILKCGRLDPTIEGFTSGKSIQRNRRDPRVSNPLMGYVDCTTTLRDSTQHSKLMEDLKMSMWMAKGLNI